MNYEEHPVGEIQARPFQQAVNRTKVSSTMVNLHEPRKSSLGVQLLVLVLFLVICLAAGGLGGLVTYPRIPNWYAQLVKPSWNPPNWVFGPVWTTLYVMMAIAAWLVWRQAGFHGAKVPLTLFGLQLALNSLWSILFFGLQRPDLSGIEIVLLWIAIAATLVSFWGRSKWAGWLLLPYLAWVTYAATLNAAIWWLNR